MKDFVGREIKVGDIVIYPVRRGSHMSLHRARVTAITDASVHAYRLDVPKQSGVIIYNIDNCVVEVPLA